MIGVRPLFSGRSLGEGEQATFDVVVVGPDGAALTRSGLRYELLQVETRYQWYRRDNTWDFEPVKLTRRVADGQVNVAAGTPGRISLPVQWGRYRLEISTGERDGPVTSIGFDAGWYTEATADTPDMLEVALDKPEYAPGENMTVAVTARTAGKVTLNVIGERLLTTVTQDVKPGTARLQLPVGKDWGTGAYVVATLAPSARRQRPAHARPRHRRAVVRRQPPGAHARGRHGDAEADAARQRLAHSGQDRRARRRRGGAHRRRRRRCRHPQSHQLQAAGAGRPLSRPAPPRGRAPRSLRPAHRRHAGHARSDPQRRRWPRRRAAGQPAGAEAARALFRHRHGQARRHRRDRVRHPRLRRHRPRDGGGVVAATRSAAPRPTSPSATRWWSPRRCRASCTTATAAPCISTSTTSKGRPATTASR